MHSNPVGSHQSVGGKWELSAKTFVILIIKFSKQGKLSIIRSPRYIWWQEK